MSDQWEMGDEVGGNDTPIVRFDKPGVFRVFVEKVGTARNNRSALHDVQFIGGPWDGRKARLTGSTVLDPKLEQTVGMAVQIEYQGMQAADNGQQYRAFRVHKLRARSHTVDAAEAMGAVQTGAAPAPEPASGVNGGEALPW